MSATNLCEHCGKPFTPEKPWGKYCCVECGDKARHLRYYKRKVRAMGRRYHPRPRPEGSPATR